MLNETRADRGTSRLLLVFATAEYTTQEAASLLRIRFLFDGLLEDRHCYIRVAHGTLLSFLLLGAGEPFHEAIVVEDVTA